MDERGGLNKDEAYKLASYLCNVAGSAFDVVIEVFWSNPWLNRVLLPCFLQISKVFVHDDSLNFLYSPVIPCSQLSYSDHSAGPIIKCLRRACRLPNESNLNACFAVDLLLAWDRILLRLRRSSSESLQSIDWAGFLALRQFQPPNASVDKW